VKFHFNNSKLKENPEEVLLAFLPIPTPKLTGYILKMQKRTSDSNCFKRLCDENVKANKKQTFIQTNCFLLHYASPILEKHTCFDERRVWIKRGHCYHWQRGMRS